MKFTGRYSLTVPRDRRPGEGIDGAALRGPVPRVRHASACPELDARASYQATAPAREVEHDATPSSRGERLAAQIEAVPHGRILARYDREIAAARARGHALTAQRIEAERDEYLGALPADCDQCGQPVPRATLAILTLDAAGDPDLYCCRTCRGADEDES